MADLANITDRYNESDKADQNPAFLPKPSRRAEQDSLMRADVLMICKYFPPVSGGMEEYVGRLADTVGEACDLTVLAHAIGFTGSAEDWGRFRLIRAGTIFTLLSQPLSPGMIRVLLAKRYDLIHLHVPNPFAVLLVLVLGRGARVVVTHHADMVGFGLIGRAARALYALLLKRTQIVTVLSLKNHALAFDLAGSQVACAALPVGLDAVRFTVTADVVRRRQELRAGMMPNDVLFVFVGRLVAYKGLDVLIRALKDVPNARCIVGGDGRERQSLQTLSCEIGVEDRLTFLGHISDQEKVAVMHAADVFVLPSTTTAEAFGIAQVEAQLCGLPVIATDLPTGVTEVTLDRETGLIIPPGDAPALAAAMRELTGDRELRRRLGAAGRARAEANYIAETMRRKAIEIYQRALA